MKTDCSLLRLDHQVCFPLYAVSRMITQQYKPLLDQLDITYPQYLVLLVLWETNGVPVKELSEKLFLESNTLTPLLKRLEQKELVSRVRSAADERKVIISLTQKGEDLKSKAKEVPTQLINQLDCLAIGTDEVTALKQILDKFLNTLNSK